MKMTLWLLANFENIRWQGSKRPSNINNSSFLLPPSIIFAE